MAMNSYPLRRSKRCESSSNGDITSCAELSLMVDLTSINSDDGSDSDSSSCVCIGNLVQDASQPKIITSIDGRYQSLSTPLVASLYFNNRTKKDVKVTLKWKAPRTPYRQSERIKHNNRTEDDNMRETDAKEVNKYSTNPYNSSTSVSDKFDTNEKIFAWDKGHLYEAKVKKCKIVMGEIKYYVHYSGYKKSHDRWLDSHEMLKDTPSSRKFYENQMLEWKECVQSVDEKDTIKSDNVQNSTDEHTQASTKQVAYKGPRVGMRVSVQFDKDEVYSGKIIGVRVVATHKMAKSASDHQPKYDIKIMYDDGIVEDTQYPDEDITLGCDYVATKNKGDRSISESRTSKKRGEVGISNLKGDSVKTNKRKRKSPRGTAQPEVVTSQHATSSNSTSEDSYDEDDYANLHQRYLMPRIREKVELPTGLTLRRQCKGRMIDQNTPGFRMLRSEVDALLKKNNHSEVYRLLCQLRNWELDPRRIPQVFQDCGDEAVEEVLDLTKEDDGSGNTCINVDEYITDVLLVPQTLSSSLPEFAASSSSKQVHRVTPNQSLNESTPHDRNECNEEETPVTVKQEQQVNQTKEVTVTRGAIKEVESFVYSVIDTVIQASSLINTKTTPTKRKNIQPSTTSRNTQVTLKRSNNSSSNPRVIDLYSDKIKWDDIPKPPGQLTITECHKLPTRSRTTQVTQKLMTHDPSNPQGIDLYSNKIKWDDIPKPPGQLTIDECDKFHVKRAVGDQGRDYLTTQTQRQHLSDRPSWMFPPSLHPHNAFTSQTYRFHGHSNLSLSNVRNQNGFNHAMRLNQQNTTIHHSQLVVPETMNPMHTQVVHSPKMESVLVSPTKANNKKSPAKVVTPEGNQKQKKKTRRRRLNRKKLHFASQSYASRFMVTDFGFASSKNVISEGTDGMLSASGCGGGIGSKRKSRSHESLDCTYPRPIKRRRRFGVGTASFSIVTPSRSTIPNQVQYQTGQGELNKEWNKQVTQRNKGEWMPSGRLTGRWKPPAWADVKNEAKSTKKKPPGCSKSLLPTLNSLLSDFLIEMKVSSDTSEESCSSSSLQDVICPQYLQPTFNLLRCAHSAVSKLLPQGDCEEYEVVELAKRYYNHWRPQKVKVILLAESHAFTTKERAFRGPGLDDGCLSDAYKGPREFLSLVYCLAYGENEALSQKINDKSNKGSPQFWTLFAACTRGVDHIATTNKKECTSKFAFAADLLKSGGLDVNERLKAKLQVLEQLKSRGIWLLDASVFGWYMPQPQVYARSSITNEIHRKQKNRPPKDLKTPSLVLSWELFTKHLIRDVADEGNLKLLVPIGMEVEAALTRDRMEDAVTGKSKAKVSDAFPAPNAWIPGGYGPFYSKLNALINEATPKRV